MNKRSVWVACILTVIEAILILLIARSIAHARSVALVAMLIQCAYMLFFAFALCVGGKKEEDQQDI